MTADYTEASLATLARWIDEDWSARGKGVNYAARPYLDAMKTLNVRDPHAAQYYCDSGISIVLYFLSNASSWRGETAKSIKAELRKRCGQ